MNANAGGGATSAALESGGTGATSVLGSAAPAKPSGKALRGGKGKAKRGTSEVDVCIYILLSKPRIFNPYKPLVPKDHLIIFRLKIFKNYKNNGT